MNSTTKINLDVGVIKNLDLSKFKNILVLTGVQYSNNVFESVIKPKIKGKIHLFPNIPVNPTDSLIYRIVSFASDKKIDCILSIGGKDVMDCGRFLSFLLPQGGPLPEYLMGGKKGPQGITDNVIYHITVPVVCSLGAEISDMASFFMNKRKVFVASPYLMPKVTYIDPQLMQGLPYKLWASMSVGVFGYAVSAYTSRFANPTSDSFAEEALKKYITVAPELIRNPNNLEYIKQVEVASINAFLAVRMSSFGAIQAIADMLSAKFNFLYGIAQAVVCAEVCERSYQSNKAKFDKILKMLGGRDIKTAVKKFIDRLSVDLPPLKGKIDKSNVDAFARECFNYKIEGNPKVLTPKEVTEILVSLP